MILIGPPATFGAETQAARFSIEGVNSSRGAYRGLLSVEDGKAVRVVQYDRFRHEGLKVQEVWEGSPARDGGWLFFTSLGHYIYRVDETRSSRELAFSSSAIACPRPDANGFSFSFINSDGSRSVEKGAPFQGEAPPEWAFHPETGFKDAYSPTPLLASLGVKAAKAKMGWSHDPAVAGLLEISRTPFCADGRAKVFHDFTDADFYRRFPDSLRVYNSPAHVFALTESLYRRSAFKDGLIEKARAAEEEAFAGFINPAGLLSRRTTDEQGRKRFIFDHDSALWTGEYLSYLSRRLSEAEPGSERQIRLAAEVRKISLGLISLVEAFRGTHEFGRTAEELLPGETAGGRWVIYKGPGGFVAKVEKGGNNDMFKGLILGLLSADLAVKKIDPDLHEKIASIAPVIMELRVARQSRGNRQLALALASVAVESEDYRKRFAGSFNPLIPWVYKIYDGNFYWNGTSDYSGINLAMAGLYAAGLAARHLRLDGALRNLRAQALTKKKNFSALPHFGILLINKALNNGRLEAEEQRELDRALQTIPYPRPRHGVSFDHSGSGRFCLSSTPSRFWKALGDKPQKPADHLRTLVSLPIYQSSGIDSNFIVKDAYFEYRGECSAGAESSPADVLFIALLYGESL
jgi:hypothetical protein